MANQFSVQPADISMGIKGALAGLEARNLNQQRVQAQAKQQALTSQAQELFRSGDLNAIAEFSIANPEYGDRLSEQTEIRGAAAKDTQVKIKSIRGEVQGQIMSGADPYAAINAGARRITDLGGDPSRMLGLLDLSPEEIVARTGPMFALEHSKLSQDLQKYRKGSEPVVVAKDAALVDPKTGEKIYGGAGAGVTPLIPKSLTKNLPLDLAAAAGDAFTAAGGGKDGMIAFQAVVAVDKEERKETTKANVRRITELSQTSRERASAIVKAQEFLNAFENEGAESGTTRTLASFFPGTFSDQAAFDQKFNAFAEVAARQKLKAAGEIRPTDADVEGMKRAMFGVGRDEDVNIQLLKEFINDLGSLDDELSDLKDAKTSKRLDTYTGSRMTAVDLQALSWARKNPNDPRAKAIIQKLESR